MLVIRIEDEHKVSVFDEEDMDKYCEIEADFDELTIEDCLSYYRP